VAVHAGDHHDVDEWSDGEEVFETVLRTEVMNVVVAHRQRVPQDREADGVCVAADTAERDGVFVHAHFGAMCLGFECLRRTANRLLGKRI